MTDVKFDQIGDCNDRLHVMVIQSVPRIHLQSLRMGVFRRNADARQLMVVLRNIVRIGIFSGV